MHLGIASERERSIHYALENPACGTGKVTAGKSMFFEAGLVKRKEEKKSG